MLAQAPEVSTPPSDQRPRRVAAHHDEVGSELLVYRAGDPEGYSLNNAAADVWELCDGSRTVADLCRTLSRRYGVGPEAFAQDVRSIVDQLGALRLVTFEATGRAPATRWEHVLPARGDLYGARIALASLLESSRAERFLATARLPGRALTPRLGLRSFYALPADLEPCPSDHRNLRIALELFDLWPEVTAEVNALLHSLQPLLIRGRPDDGRGFLGGARCHSEHEQPGTLWATANCPLMLAEAIVHEMAHQKLFYLGVFKESRDRFVLNAPDELYRSPVIRDRGRPMTAVIHGVYAFCYVADLDFRVLPTLAGERRLKLLGRLNRHLDRLAEGRAEIEAHLRADAEGAALFQGMLDWIGDLQARGRDLPGSDARPSAEPT